MSKNSAGCLLFYACVCTCTSTKNHSLLQHVHCNKAVRKKRQTESSSLILKNYFIPSCSCLYFRSKLLFYFFLLFFIDTILNRQFSKNQIMYSYQNKVCGNLLGHDPRWVSCAHQSCSNPPLLSWTGDKKCNERHRTKTGRYYSPIIIMGRTDWINLFPIKTE